MPRVVVYTKEDCPYCLQAKQLLEEKGVTYAEINVSEQPEKLKDMVARSGSRTAPEIFIDDELVGGWDELTELNSRGDLDQMLGLAEPDREPEEVKLVILGSGCAGLTAAIYAARARLDPIVVEGNEPGGQLFTTTDVENYPGFPEGIQGPELISLMKAQAERFGARCVQGQATAVDLSDRPFQVTLEDSHSYSTHTLIIATGASPRELGLESERRLRGHGVSTCATCDGPFFRDQRVVVVGGGDTAMEDALFITKFASEVVVVHRRDQLRSSKIMQEKAFENEKISFLWNTEVRDIKGSPEDGVKGVRLINNQTGEEWDLECEGVFVAIGHVPNTQIFEDYLNMEKGYIQSPNHFPYTRVEGVFVSGDCHDYVYRQAVTAAGFGCMAAIAAERFLERVGVK